MPVTIDDHNVDNFDGGLIMRMSLKSKVLAAASFALLTGSLACQPLPEQKTPLAKPIETTKPTPFSRIRVIEKSLREFSRIERPLRAFFDSAFLNAADSCQTTTKPAGLVSATKWSCGTDPRERGRKEIVGSETVEFEKETSSLIYTAKLTVTNFDDLEPRDKAHALEIQRRIVIQFANGSSRSNIKAQVSGYLRTSLKDGTVWKGSNFEIKLKGSLSGDALNPILDHGSSISYSGSLWGEDGMRGTYLAAGQYTFIASSPISFESSTSDSCGRPVGSWEILANGGGTAVSGSAASSLGSVSEDGGMTLAWDPSFCSSP